MREVGEALGFKSGRYLMWKKEKGYLIEFLELAHQIRVNISTDCPQGQMPMAVGEVLAGIDQREEVVSCIINGSWITLLFKKDRFTVDCIQELLHEILETLEENRVPILEICPVCQTKIGYGEEAIIDINDRALRVHKSCYEQLLEKESEPQDEGSYVTGTLGALLFGALGTIPWVIVGLMGWVASVLGLLIAYAANFGYKLFKGKEGPAKSVILMVTIVLAVISAAFSTTLIQLFNYLGEIGTTDVTIGDGLRFIWLVFKEDAQFRNPFIFNILVGLGFAMFGAYRFIFNKAASQSKAKPYIALLDEEQSL